jgi:hypothetical protein
MTAQDDTGGAAGGGGEGGSGGVGAAAGHASGGKKIDYDAGVDAPRTPQDAYSEYVDPGCPDAPMKTVDMQCDPMAPLGGDCPEGTACYPFVESPMGVCGTETYGTECAPSGTGTQGDPCDNGCAPNYLCVVSGQGTQCVQLCDVNAAMGCSGGLICTPVDIPGIGGCL